MFDFSLSVLYAQIGLLVVKSLSEEMDFLQEGGLSSSLLPATFQNCHNLQAGVGLKLKTLFLKVPTVSHIFEKMR